MESDQVALERGRLDAVIAGLLFMAGMRRSEVSALVPTSPTRPTATSGCWVTVRRGKRRPRPPASSGWTAHSGRVGLASELTSRGASTTDVMLAGNWATSSDSTTRSRRRGWRTRFDRPGQGLPPKDDWS